MYITLCIFKHSRTIGSVFLSQLTHNYLRQELSLFEAYNRHDAQTSAIDFTSANTIICRTRNELAKSPLGPAGPQNVRLLCTQLKRLKGDTDYTNIMLKIARRNIMLSNHEVWMWLDGTVRDRCQDVLLGRGQGTCWVDQLVLDMRELSTLPLRRREISASKYSPNLTGVWVYDPPRRNKYMEPEEMDTFAIDITIAATSHWLGYEDCKHGLPRARGWLTDALLRVYGRGILLLDRTWEAHEYIKTRIINDAKCRCITRASVETFANACMKHSLAIKGSPEREQLCAINACGERVSSSDVFTCNTGATVGYNAVLGTASLTSMRANIMVDPAQQGMRAFATYLRRLRPLAQGGVPPSLRHDKFMLRVDRQRDRLLPFRERAPSRLRVTGPGGIYDSDSLRTQRGAFQQAIFRGVTFAAKVLTEPDFPVTYKDLAAFESAIMGRTIDEVRNMVAYHTPMYQRGPAHAGRYWESSAEWPAFVGETAELPFEECYNFFIGNSKHDSCKRFPWLGPLAAFMAAGDMSFTECVASPSARMVGEHIFTIGKTSFTQLKELHLIGANATKLETAAASDRLHRFLLTDLTAQEIADMRYDERTMEHGLCKMGVAAKLKYL